MARKAETKERRDGAAALGRLGGRNRWRDVPAEERSRQARHASRARWRQVRAYAKARSISVADALLIIRRGGGPTRSKRSQYRAAAKARAS